jgi:dolichol kinase
MHSLSFIDEFKRKIVHFASSIFGILILSFEYEQLFPLFLICAILFPVFDYIRIRNKRVKEFYNSIFSSITRGFESQRLTGASFVFIGAFLSLILFDSRDAAIALLIMSNADAMAAIVGVGFGKTHLFGKTLEGTFAFFLTSLLILFIFKVPIFIAVIISFIVTMVELIGIPKINDNISIPLTVGTLLNMFTYI